MASVMGLCNGKITVHTGIYVPGRVKALLGVFLLLRLEICLGSLLHRLGVCSMFLCWLHLGSSWLSDAVV